MSAERLREAAALMRSRARMADPAPWKSDASVEGDVVIFDATGKWMANVDSGRKYAGGVVCFDHEVANGEHIASWHPAVALAVADWLDHEALVADDFMRETHPDSGYAYVGPALAVINAYLGDAGG